ncbi:hypothetical protein GCM10009845_31170 [Pedococcus bigeumensis]
MGILGTALWIYCLFDVIMTDESRIRNLPKVTWIFVVLITSVVGAVAWLVAGRPQTPQRSLPYKGNTGAAFPEYERPGRFVPTNPDDDAEFLRKVRERAEAQTREAKRQRLERERLAAEQLERERERRRGSNANPGPNATGANGTGASADPGQSADPGTNADPGKGADPTSEPTAD